MRSERKWKKEPNDETFKQHKHGQVKCKALIRQAKREFAESKTRNKELFKYIHSKNPVRESVGPLDDKGVKGALRGDKAVAERLNVFTEEDVGMLPMTEVVFKGAEELKEISIHREDVLQLLDKLIVYHLGRMVYIQGC